MQLLYFAWVREAIGLGEEQLELPAGVTTVAALVDHLRARGGGYAQAFADPARLRAAVDQDFVGLEASIVDARELAIFPPVTGG